MFWWKYTEKSEKKKNDAKQSNLEGWRNPRDEKVHENLLGGSIKSEHQYFENYLNTEPNLAEKNYTFFNNEFLVLLLMSYLHVFKRSKKLTGSFTLSLGHSNLQLKTELDETTLKNIICTISALMFDEVFTTVFCFPHSGKFKRHKRF